MSNALEFLSALIGEYEGALTFDHNGEIVATGDVEWIKAHAGELSICAGNPDGTACFVYGFDEEGDRDSWRSYKLAPTAVLFNETYGAIAFWALEGRFKIAEVQPLADALGMKFEEALPLPGAGWELVHLDPDTFQALGELTAVYGPQPENPDEAGHLPDIDDDYLPEEIQEVASDEPENPAIAGHELDIAEEPAAEALPWDEEQLYGEAVVKTPGWWPDNDPQLHQKIIVSRGANSESKRWVPTEIVMGGFLATLCSHKEGGKDGAAFVCGEVVGDRRTANAMKALYAVGLDIDVGMSSAEIDERIAKLGCVAIRYTTHSHMKTSSEFRKDAVVKFAGDREVDDELIREFLREVHKVDPRIADTAEFLGFDHVEGGIVARVEHAPWPKNRVVFPLAAPFVVADEGRTQKDAIEKWKKVPMALAAELGVPIDKTGVDPSRLFYYPRHKKGRPHEIALFGGALLDWRSLELDDAFALVAAEMEKTSGVKTSKSKTQEGRDLGRWSMKAAHGFQIADLLNDHCEDRVRAQVSAGIEIECPFDEMHSNAGDPEDRACLATNAGDGPSEWFVIKCQHEGCRDFTNLDMLGKMVKDGWFAREVLDEEAYNAAAPEEAPNPQVATKIAAEDEARDGIEEKVARVNKDSSLDEVRTILAEIVRTGDRLIVDKLSKQVKSQCGLDMKTVRGIINEFTPKEDKAKQEADGARPGEELVNKSTGVTLFRYYSEFNKDEGLGACLRSLKRANGDGLPHFSCNLNEPVQYRFKDGRVQFAELDRETFWAELCERIQFQRVTDAGAGARDQVPDKVASQLFKTAWKHLPTTPEVIYTPMFNPDGHLITTPGWYPDLGILLVDTGFIIPEVPAQPTAEDIEDALAWIKVELLSDFPFLDMDETGEKRREPSEANALAMLITPFMRRMIDGCTPVFFVAKPTPGTGGTMLGKLPMLLFDGEESFPLGYYRDNEEEQRKSLISAIMETRSHLFFDDVKEFNNRVLLQSITSRKIGGRLLGKSQNVERPNTFNWVGTGNNPFIGDEMARRIAWIRLNAETADIQNRKFRHKNFPAFVKEKRATAVWCILTLIQAWIAAGRPPFEERSLTSFEEWARIVGGVLQHAGVEGFLDNRRAVSMDMDFAAARGFILEWLAKFQKNKVSPKALIDHAMLMELDVVEGNNDDQKRFRLRKRLESLEGVTFEIGAESLMVRRVPGDDGSPNYMLEPLKTAEAA